MDENKKLSFGQRLILPLKRLLLREPKDQQQLVEVLHEAEQRNVLNAHSLNMIEGVLDFSEIVVDDIMIPRSQMVVIHENNSIDEILPIIVESGHSRYPVVDENFEKVLGVLIVKDLLRIGFSEEYKKFNITQMLREPMFVTESRRLDILLREFRAKHMHMGIVLDEYGSVTGLVTIEDILEQIVGDIEDEHDIEEETPEIIKQDENEFIIQAQLTIEDFNAYFDADLDDGEFNTIGGIVMHAAGHVLKRGEKVTIDEFEFVVVHADDRKIISLRVFRR